MSRLFNRLAIRLGDFFHQLGGKQTRRNRLIWIAYIGGGTAGVMIGWNMPPTLALITMIALLIGDTASFLLREDDQ